MLADNILDIAGKSRITTEEAIMLCEAKIEDFTNALKVGIERNDEKRIARNTKSINHWSCALDNVKKSELTDTLITTTLFDEDCVKTGKVGMLFKRK